MTGTPITVYNRSAAANSRPGGHPRHVRSRAAADLQQLLVRVQGASGPRRASVRRPVGRARAERELHARRTTRTSCASATSGTSRTASRFRSARTCGWPARCRSPWGITLSGSLQSNRGVAIGTAPGSTTTPPTRRRSRSARPRGTRRTARRRARPARWSSVRALTVTTLTVPLVPYLVNVADRINQLDVKASKTFRMSTRSASSPSVEAVQPDQPGSDRQLRLDELRHVVVPAAEQHRAGADHRLGGADAVVGESRHLGHVRSQPVLDLQSAIAQVASRASSKSRLACASACRNCSIASSILPCEPSAMPRLLCASADRRIACSAARNSAIASSSRSASSSRLPRS